MHAGGSVSSAHGSSLAELGISCKAFSGSGAWHVLEVLSLAVGLTQVDWKCVSMLTLETRLEASKADCRPWGVLSSPSCSKALEWDLC